MSFYHHDTRTPIQRRIELDVTNGRGYETVAEAIDIVNNPDLRSTQERLDSEVETQAIVKYNNACWIMGPSDNFNIEVTIADVIERGIIPLYFGGPLKRSSFVNRNPCGEIQLGESMPCTLPMPTREPTILEQVQSIQFGRFHDNCMRTGVLA